MGNKNPAIDIAKGIAIILVVYGHVIEHSMAPWNQDFFANPVFKIIYAFHMPLFVFISGYLMANSFSKHSVDDVFKSRCKTLLVPFLSLAILGSIIIYGLNSGRVSLASELVDQLFVQPQVWFLFTLFILSCLLIISVKLEKRFGVIIFAGIYILLMVIPYNTYCALYCIKWFYLFYLTGYFVNKYKVKTLGTPMPMIVLAVALIIFSWLIIFWTKNDYIYVNKMNFSSNQYFSEVLRIIYRYITGLAGISIIFCIAKYLSGAKAFSFLEVIGIYSLDIYIIQMLIVEGIYPRLMYKAGIHLDFNSPVVIYILAPLMSMLFVGACMLISRSFIRKNRILNSLLLGGRNVDNRRN